MDYGGERHGPTPVFRLGCHTASNQKGNYMDSAMVRKRLEAQGFCGLDDATMDELGPWLRWSQAFCTIVMAVGTALASPPILWALAVIASIGVALPFHPFDLFYNYGFRHVVGTRAFPHHGVQRRFACGLAAAWLIGTGLAFDSGQMTAGYALGWSLTAVAALVSTTHFCIPSLIFNTVAGALTGLRKKT